MPAPSVSALVDVVVLAFSRSQLKELVGTDALRMVLSGKRNELVPDGDRLVMEPVWELLESQPGFEPKRAWPPFCRLKQLESRLGVIVELPAALDELDQRTRDEQALYCHVPDDELTKILEPQRVVAKVAAPIAVVEVGTAPIHRASNAKLIASIVFALLAIGGVITSYMLTMAKPSSTTKSLAPADLTTEIPISNVRQSGAIIAITVSDPQWVSKPEAERRRQLEAAAVKAQRFAVKTLIILDGAGNTIANVGVKPLTVILRK